MFKFVVRRVAISVVILFFVMFAIYLLMRMLPTSYLESVARDMVARPGNTKSKEEWMAELGAIYGGNKNVFAGFFHWLGNAVRGNFGDSWLYSGSSVTSKFSSVIWNSFILGLVSTVIYMSVAIPLGRIAARKQYSKTDYAISVTSLVGISLPVFFAATLLKFVFAMELNWFSISGMRSSGFQSMTEWEQFFDQVAHFVLPVITLVIISVGGMMRYTRANMLEVLNADYIRTARAKGLYERRVINHHAFRNTLIPIVTIIGGSIPALFAGSLITETLFKIDGIGYTAYNAMLAGDIPFTMFYMTFLAAMTLLGTLISDILYAVADPRVRVT